MSKKRKHVMIGEEQDNLRIDQALPALFEGLSRTRAKREISQGDVWVNGRPLKVMSRKVFKGDRITWFTNFGKEEKPYEAPPKFTPESPQDPEDKRSFWKKDINWDAYGGRPEFLYRDNQVAIVNKPTGIPTEPTPNEDLRTVLRQIEAVMEDEGLHPKRIYVAAAHRLDAGASGALAFALRKSVAGPLANQFAERTASRVYHALVAGVVKDDEGTMTHHLGKISGVKQGVVSPSKGKLAVTDYRVLKRFENETLVEVKLQTGRTHQIRVQMAAIGHPLIGDWLYLPEEEAAKHAPCERLMLHAVSLTLTHPKKEEELVCEAPHPSDFSDYLDLLSPMA